MKKIAGLLLLTISTTMVQTDRAAAQADAEQTTGSGLKYRIIQHGTGVQAKAGDKVSVHYVGTLPNGTKFDSSRDRGQPFSFNLGSGQVIRGWDEGIALLRVGDKAILTIPPDLGYGAQEAGSIPANSILVFEVELMDVQEKVNAVPFEVKGKDTLDLQEGLKMILVQKGTGAKPEVGKTVSVHYTGYLPDGTKFDSSIERGEPIAFPLGQGHVIRGWDLGIAALNIGSKARLLIPYALGYGDNGYPPIIPAKSNLIFDVELVGVQ